jgi:predicted nucleotidyltransferase
MTAPGRSDLEIVRDIVLRGLTGLQCRVVLFGSRAKGHPGRASDVDVAVLPREPLPRGALSSIREALEESRVPWRVDLVDLSDVDPSFRSRVLDEGIEWTA